jgi:hypothetical protein
MRNKRYRNMTEEKMTEEKLKQKVAEAIDELGDTTKKVGKKIFEGMVARTVEVLSELLDKQKVIIKNKVKGADKDDNQKST